MKTLFFLIGFLLLASNIPPEAISEVEVSQVEVCECELLEGIEVCECSDLGGEVEAQDEIAEIAQRELTTEEAVLLYDMTGAENGM